MITHLSLHSLPSLINLKNTKIVSIDLKEIESIAMEHQVDYYLASILYASKTEKKL